FGDGRVDAGGVLHRLGGIVGDHQVWRPRELDEDRHVLKLRYAIPDGLNKCSWSGKFMSRFRSEAAAQGWAKRSRPKLLRSGLPRGPQTCGVVHATPVPR